METKTTLATLPVAQPPGARLAVRPEAQIVSRELNRFAYEPNGFADMAKWVDIIWDAAIVPESIKRKEHAFIMIATGREFGMSMMQSLRQLFIVNGRVGLYTATMVAMIQQSPVCEYFDTVESTDESCTVKCKRRNSKHERVVTYTKADAVRAGLWDDPKKASTWGKHPRRMILWRAQSEAGVTEFPDVTNGLSAIETMRDDFGEEPAPARVPEIRLPSVTSTPVDITPRMETRPTSPAATEPPHDRITGEVLDANGAPETPEEEPTRQEPETPAEPAVDPAVAALRGIIAAAKDGPTITAARDAILAAILGETISAIELKPLVVLLLARCGNPSDRNRVSGMILTLRDAKKLPEALLADLRAEFDKARKGGA